MWDGIMTIEHITPIGLFWLVEMVIGKELVGRDVQKYHDKVFHQFECTHLR
jgi:hypothetical protein